MQIQRISRLNSTQLIKSVLCSVVRYEQLICDTAEQSHGTRQFNPRRAGNWRGTTRCFRLRDGFNQRNCTVPLGSARLSSSCASSLDVIVNSSLRRAHTRGVPTAAGRSSSINALIKCQTARSGWRTGIV